MSLIPVGSDVIVRIDRVYATMEKAEVTVVAVEGRPTALQFAANPFRGSIRLQDVRSFDIDKATIADHFQSGDIVRAKTIAIGDAKSSFFSTTGADYGVILAKGHDGEFLVPVDQSHMRTPDNSIVFKRKVAKPVWLTTGDAPPETTLDN